MPTMQLRWCDHVQSEQSEEPHSGDRSSSLPPLAPKRPAQDPDAASGGNDGAAAAAAGSNGAKSRGMKHSRSLNSDKFDALLMAATGESPASCKPALYNQA